MGTGRMDKNSHDSLRVGAGNDDKVNEDWFLEDNTSQMALVPHPHLQPSFSFQEMRPPTSVEHRTVQLQGTARLLSTFA